MSLPEAMALAAGLSERRLSAAFRLAFGAGPFEVLRDHRLEHARQALEQGGVSLKEVSFRVGYSHVSTSCTPSGRATARRRGSTSTRADLVAWLTQARYDSRALASGWSCPVCQEEPYS